MPDEDDDEVLLPKDSKCNTCKFGLCLAEDDMQSFFQPTPPQDPNVFDDHDPGEMTGQPGLSQVTFPISKVRSVCFWRPATMQSSMISPLVFNCVTECSKYENNR